MSVVDLEVVDELTSTFALFIVVPPPVPEQLSVYVIVEVG